MQKKIVAMAVAGLSTAAFAQTNVTIYGVADVSAQGYTMSSSKALANTDGTKAASGSVFTLQSNSSLIGFKGTEDLGNGLKALFQAETTLNMTGNDGGNGKSGTAFGPNSDNSVFGGLRDTFVALNSKYGTGQVGYISTPFRSSLNSFDVMPGATGSSQIEIMMGNMRFGQQALSNSPSTNAQAYSSSIRATAIAYAMPTLYGFDASIAYTGSNNNGGNNSTDASGCSNDVSACTMTPQSAWGFNLGWTGYGVNVKGAFQQANYNVTQSAGDTLHNTGDYTSYLVGAMYTGIPGLKLSTVYNRNTLGTNQGSNLSNGGAGKLTNNQLWAGASYRMGNWEPRVSAVWNSDINGSQDQQLGARQWTANVGYYLSKRTQVYGLVSNLNNSANQNYAFGQQTNNLKPTGGQNLFTYGMGVRTTF